MEKVSVLEFEKSLPKQNEEPIPTLNLPENQLIVVLDDDPTGTQTVQNIPVLTKLDEELIEKELITGSRLFYILTNSRSLQEQQTRILHKRLASTLLRLSQKYHRRLRIISRSDSTLRGHFPLEAEVLGAELFPNVFYTTLIIPAFIEGGRFTFQNIHWVKEGEHMIPAGESPYAKDGTFGYKSSDLYDWIMEKSHGHITQDEIGHLSLDSLRFKKSSEYLEEFMELCSKKILILNACDYDDLQKIAWCIQMAENKGRHILIRSAASIVPCSIGMQAPEPLKAEEINCSTEAGLIVVGSYVPKSTSQLSLLIEEKGIIPIKLDATKFSDPDAFDEEVRSKAKQLNQFLQKGKDVVLYTSRTLLSTSDKQKNLQIVNKVSHGVLSVVGSLKSKPGFVIAKGGITSSQVATQSLKIQRAMVLGSILPGVPLWKGDEASKFPGLPYIVFPGNVGHDEDLRSCYRKLKASQKLSAKSQAKPSP